MRHLYTSAATALVLVLTPAAAFGAAEWTFKDIDADNNLELTEKEFERVSNQAFSTWDADGNQRLARGELERGMYRAWDRDRDGRVSEAEFNEGYLGWFGNDQQASFSGYDADADGFLTDQEFSTGLDRAGALSGWNVEGDGMDLAAFHDRLYEAYDGDRNDMIAEAEYSRFGDNALVGAETTAAVGQQPIQPNEVVRIADWEEENLYAGGISVERMIDDYEVYGPTGEEIGGVENVVFSRDGRALSIIAEIGGLWDIGDTHVNIPWDQVNLTTAGRVIVPVTEENVDNYSFAATDYLTAYGAQGNLQVVDDDLTTGPRAFRGSELIGDYARIKDGDGYANYGYVNDLIIRGDQLQAVVVNPDAGFGTRGAYAYPFYGRGFGFGPFYDMPYERDEALGVEPLEYDRFAAAD